VRRVVLDDCVPRTLLPHLGLAGPPRSGDLGWVDIDDGPLLDRLPDVCAVFITVDRNLRFNSGSTHGHSRRR
jgi:hypothetical protein